MKDENSKLSEELKGISVLGSAFTETMEDELIVKAIKAEQKYEKLKAAYVELWQDTENGTVGEFFFSHRENYRSLTE